jgi:two-component system cell cycle sensor histidine kinase/response regulator CckA
MFEPFFTTKSEGTGLGLAMVHGIVHQHRGHLHVESQLGQGTKVRVLLPLADVPETHERHVPSRAPGRGAGETILVAEDEPALRRMLATTLIDMGYEVLVAPDGEEAVHAFDAWPGTIAMVVLDVVMPRMGGVEAFQRMRALNPSVKVLFTTGYAADRAQVRELGESGHPPVLSKPFTPRELARCVREQLDTGLKLMP